MWGHLRDRHRAHCALSAGLVLSALGALGAFAAPAVALGAFAAPAVALGAGAIDATTSANWSGYAAHGGHVHFRRAAGIWRVPKLTCTPGRRTYSAVWVGIGGYALNARALEQTGTETDCRRDGSTRTTAWFEVVPTPSRSVQMNVKPGDLIAAAVTVSGTDVTLTLRDLTTHRHFTRELLVRHPDTSSAEWIVEAPSDCSSIDSTCRTLPLADFGRVQFTHATARTLLGREQGITSRRWRTTRILLHTTTPARPAAGMQPAKAIPSALGAARQAFSVAYQTSAAATGAAPGSGPGGQPPVSGPGGQPPGIPGG